MPVLGGACWACRTHPHLACMKVHPLLMLHSMAQVTLVYQAPGGAPPQEVPTYLSDNSRLHLSSVCQELGLSTIKLDGVLVPQDATYSPVTYESGARIQVSGSIQLAEGGGGVLQPDDSRQHAEALFAPFDAATFPTQLDSSRLSQLLVAAPASRVPATLRDPNLWPSSLQPLFRPQARPAPAGKLAERLLQALGAEWPRGNASELLYTQYWGNIGFSLPEFVGVMLDQDIIIHRNVEDSTITTEGSKRGYCVVLDGLLLVGGEDKSSPGQLKNAVKECSEKHKGANAALYGQLGYILLTVVAADRFSVYGMRLDPSFSMECLVPEFSIKSQPGRAKALLTFVNITRWIRTVAELRLLPPRPTLPMFQPFKRPSPFQGECPESLHTTLEVRLRSVCKEFVIPARRLQNLLDVYYLLNSGVIPGTVFCKCLKVGGEVVVLQMGNRSFSGRPRLVHLVLTPVAAAWELGDNAALRCLCADMLDTLAALHGRGFVHRDVRDANMLRGASRFLLIDWELAARAGAPVFWTAAEGRLPPGVNMGTPWQPWMDLWQPWMDLWQPWMDLWQPWMDLWQLGRAMQVLRARAVANAESDAFMHKLQHQQFSSAAEAQANLWS